MERSAWPAPAVIIELETALACDPQQVARALGILRLQLQQLNHRFCGVPEVVVTFDPNSWCDASVRLVIERAAGRHEWPGKLTVVPVPAGTAYYEHKNFGFGLTQSELIVFLDGDLTPDEGWLEAMLRPFVDFKVSVVVGNTYMDTSTLYARCLALFWIFEPRAARPELTRTGRLVSNSVAFRRALFAKFPFPRRDTYRGQCSELASILNSKGVALYLNSGAQSLHPPPKGIRGFVERALFAGHDECAYRNLDGPVRALHAFAAFRRDLGAVRGRIARRAPQIGSNAVVMAAAATLGFFFYTLKLGAFLMTTVSPRAVRRMLAA